MKKTILTTVMFLMLLVPIQTQAKEQKIYDIDCEAWMQQFVVLECEKANISPEFILAVMEVESLYGNDGKIKNIMQINKHFYKEQMNALDITEIETPENNIKLGIKIFHDLFAEYEDVGYVLMVYNGGKDYADELMNKGISETNYCKKVYIAQEKIYASQQ